MNDEGTFSFLWPSIDDATSAIAASRNGALAAATIATWTAVVVTYALVRGNPTPYGALAYVDAGIFAALAWGIWRMSRAAAVAALVLFLLEQILAALRTGAVGGVIIATALMLFLIAGVRGVFAFRRYQSEATDVPESIA
jgi:hypothetical protein